VTGLRLGLAVVDYTLKTRRHRARERFPLTAGWIWRVSRRLGHPVGIKRAYRIQHALIDAGIIEPAGAYKQRRFGVYTGFKVTLYRPVRCALRAAPSSIGRTSRQQARTGVWHPLFGDPELAKLFPRRLRRWREPPEWEAA
jgi:hypothetical protein